jgi:hypothetical protein
MFGQIRRWLADSGADQFRLPLEKIGLVPAYHLMMGESGCGTSDRAYTGKYECLGCYRRVNAAKR